MTTLVYATNAVQGSGRQNDASYQDDGVFNRLHRQALRRGHLQMQLIERTQFTTIDTQPRQSVQLPNCAKTVANLNIQVLQILKALIFQAQERMCCRISPLPVACITFCTVDAANSPDRTPPRQA